MNPYEIRFAILKEAREMLYEEWRHDQEAINTEFHENLQLYENDKFDGEKFSSDLKTIPAPTIDEVLSLSTKMKAFVDEGKPISPK